jgi:hypothetical protein
MINAPEIIWPVPWKPILNEENDSDLKSAWTEWRRMYPDVAPTVWEELLREMAPLHALQGVQMIPIAWNPVDAKEFVFATDRSDIPFVIVHLTWAVETDPILPMAFAFPDLNTLLTRLERSQRKA